MKIEGVTISKKCPEVFTWRGQRYIKSKLNQTKAEKLADDLGFSFIQRKATASGAEKKEKPTDPKED